jgi:hypothetical protein
MKGKGFEARSKATIHTGTEGKAVNTIPSVAYSKRCPNVPTNKNLCPIVPTNLPTKTAVSNVACPKIENVPYFTFHA